MAPSSLVNQVTNQLQPYPMEELAKIRSKLQADGKPVYDFGTGDPRIPLWPVLNETLKASLTEVSQYPRAKGSEELIDSIYKYLFERFAIERSDDLDVMATRGSKEAVFHAALSVAGRSGKNTIIFPDPGYPVYASSAKFAGAKAYPVALKVDNGYKLEPWSLPNDVQEDAAAVWVNYPHNPTGAEVDESYWLQLIDWAHKRDCVIFSDDCYVDIYQSDLSDSLPQTPLVYSRDRVVSFFSLSKRSGMTGFRSGFMAGDARFMKAHARARANMGIGTPEFIQAVASVAWSDQAHVAERRKVFSSRIALAYPRLKRLGLMDSPPRAAFYLWCRVPPSYNGDDLKFCLGLAERGVITSPSRWLSLDTKGYFRMALVPTEQDTEVALDILTRYVEESQ